MATLRHSVSLEYGNRLIKMLGPGRPKHLGASPHRESKTYMSHLQCSWSHGYRLPKTSCLRSRTRVCQVPNQQLPNWLAHETSTATTSPRVVTTEICRDYNKGTCSRSGCRYSTSCRGKHPASACPSLESLLTANVLRPNVARFALELDQHLDKLLVDSILYTLRHGCHIGYSGPRL